jgi:hypothetical protein
VTGAPMAKRHQHNWIDYIKTGPNAYQIHCDKCRMERRLIEFAGPRGGTRMEYLIDGIWQAQRHAPACLPERQKLHEQSHETRCR